MVVNPEPPGYAMSHVFISYVRQDHDIVDQLALDLRSLGVEVWVDRERIRPGERWKDAIRKAIREGSFFLCCFSLNYESRLKSFMNEELTLAIEELRLIPTDRTWFIPVKLTPCNVPPRSIGAGETLQDIHCIELYSDAESTDELEIGSDLSKPVSFLTNWRRAVKQIASVVLGPQRRGIASVLKSIEQTPAVNLRSISRNNLSIEEVITMIRKYDFYEKDWNPRGGEVLPPQCHLLNEDRDAIIAIPATGLLWQQRAKHFLVRRARTIKRGWQQELSHYGWPTHEDHIEGILTVEDHLAWLNQKEYAGFCDWRLPTVEEALSIVGGNGRVDYRFGEPRGIWTSDFASDSQNWAVEYLTGGCYPVDVLSPMTAHFSVRAVRTWMVR